MKPLLTLLLLFLFVIYANGQKTRNIAWFIPSTCSTSKINGLAIGALSGCFKEGGYDRKQVINGLDIEIIGGGFFVPLAPGPINYNDTIKVAGHVVNGCVISPAGLVA